MHGREVLGRVPSGGLLPLAITMGRTTPDGPNFFAIFRDQSQARKIDSDLLAARKQADRFVSAKADVLARISHEIRTPLNAIIGFSDVMISERFGALGNPRYGDYMKDIRACGERVIAIIDDMLNLAKIETGDLDLAFASQNLNELVEQCVAVMQPQANRERIIIRTSLAHQLPPVQADARALRQITLNLISNSIHLANAGGQVIVSTAISDLGDIVLRVRDTGHGLNDNEIAAAMEPFRTRAPTDRGPDTAGGQSVAHSRAGGSQSRAIQHQDGAAIRHADRRSSFRHKPARRCEVRRASTLRIPLNTALRGIPSRTSPASSRYSLRHLLSLPEFNMSPSRTFAASLLILATSTAAFAADEVNVYTYRETKLVQPLFDAFTKDTGVKVNVISASSGLEQRIKAEGTKSPGRRAAHRGYRPHR